MCNPKNINHRYIFLTETDRCGSKLSGNIQFEKENIHFFFIFPKICKKMKVQKLYFLNDYVFLLSTVVCVFLFGFISRKSQF